MILLNGGPVNPETILWIVAAVMLLVMLLTMVIFARVFRLWLRCFLARAGIPLPQIIGMILRKSPVEKICDLKIMAVQAGVDVRTHQIESAFLAGLDAELIVRALIHGQQTGTAVNWEQAAAQAKQDQYADYLDRARENS